jgi:hypothetical protein
MHEQVAAAGGVEQGQVRERGPVGGGGGEVDGAVVARGPAGDGPVALGHAGVTIRRLRHAAAVVVDGGAAERDMNRRRRVRGRAQQVIEQSVGEMIAEGARGEGEGDFAGGQRRLIAGEHGPRRVERAVRQHIAGTGGVEQGEVRDRAPVGVGKREDDGRVIGGAAAGRGAPVAVGHAGVPAAAGLAQSRAPFPGTGRADPHMNRRSRVRRDAQQVLQQRLLQVVGQAHGELREGQKAGVQSPRSKVQGLRTLNMDHEPSNALRSATLDFGLCSWPTAL